MPHLPRPATMIVFLKGAHDIFFIFTTDCLIQLLIIKNVPFCSDMRGSSVAKEKSSRDKACIFLSDAFSCKTDSKAYLFSAKAIYKLIERLLLTYCNNVSTIWLSLIFLILLILSFFFNKPSYQFLKA